jgi:hypothetical protein
MMRIIKTAKGVYDVYSDSGNQYIVFDMGDRWVCDCAGFIYYGKECKHIRYIKARVVQLGEQG